MRKDITVQSNWKNPAEWMCACHLFFFFLLFLETEWESSLPLPVNDMGWPWDFPSVVAVETVIHSLTFLGLIPTYNILSQGDVLLVFKSLCLNIVNSWQHLLKLAKYQTGNKWKTVMSSVNENNYIQWPGGLLDDKKHLWYSLW